MKVDAERTRNSRVNTRECSVVKATSSSCSTSSSTCIGVPMGTVGTSSTIVVVTIVQGTELVVYR